MPAANACMEATVTAARGCCLAHACTPRPVLACHMAQPASLGVPFRCRAAALSSKSAPPLQSRKTLLAARKKGSGKAAWLAACKGLEAYAQGEQPMQPLADLAPGRMCCAVLCAAAAVRCSSCALCNRLRGLSKSCRPSLLPRCSHWRLHRRHKPVGLPWAAGAGQTGGHAAGGAGHWLAV